MVRTRVPSFWPWPRVVMFLVFYGGRLSSVLAFQGQLEICEGEFSLFSCIHTDRRSGKHRVSSRTLQLN